MASKFVYQPRSSEALEKRQNQRGSSYIGFLKDEFRTYAPKKQNYIRILPPTWENAQHYGMDVFVHYEVGPQSASLLCPLKFKNSPCPLCDLQSKAEATGDDSVDFYATKRVLVWLLDRNEPADKQQPLLWAVPWTVDRDISKVCKDRQTGEMYYIDNPDTGYNVSFDREGEGQNIKYTGIQLDRRSSEVDPKFIEYVVNHPLPSVLVLRSPSEMLALLEGVAAEAEPEKKEPGPFATTTPPPKEHETTVFAPAKKLCDKFIKYKGQVTYCALNENHDGDCDYDRIVTQPEPPTETVVSKLSARAAELKERFAERK